MVLRLDWHLLFDKRQLVIGEFEEMASLKVDVCRFAVFFCCLIKSEDAARLQPSREDVEVKLLDLLLLKLDQRDLLHFCPPGFQLLGSELFMGGELIEEFSTFLGDVQRNIGLISGGEDLRFLKRDE